MHDSQTCCFVVVWLVQPRVHACVQQDTVCAKPAYALLSAHCGESVRNIVANLPKKCKPFKVGLVATASVRCMGHGMYPHSA